MQKSAQVRRKPAADSTWQALRQVAAVQGQELAADVIGIGQGQDLDEIVHYLLLCSRRDGAPPEGGRLPDCWEEGSRLGAEARLANGLRDTQAGCQRTSRSHANPSKRLT